MKLSSQAASPYRRVLVFGPPKAGKTRLVGALSEFFELDWFDFENGISTLKQLPEEWQSRIEVFPIPDTRGFPMALQTGLKVIKGIDADICVLHGTINCPLCSKNGGDMSHINTKERGLERILVFDSITQMVDSAIAWITKNQPEEYKMEWDDWGNLSKVMNTFFSYVQQAKYHIVCISHETEAELEDGTNKLVPVGGSTKFSRNVAKFFDEVIYCVVKNKRHVAASSTLYAGNILTGSRSGIVLERAEESTLVPIFTGEVKSFNAAAEAAKDTQGASAVTGLKKLSFNLKK